MKTPKSPYPRLEECEYWQVENGKIFDRDFIRDSYNRWRWCEFVSWILIGVALVCGAVMSPVIYGFALIPIFLIVLARTVKHELRTAIPRFDLGDKHSADTP